MVDVLESARRTHLLAFSFIAFAFGVLSFAVGVAWLAAIACVALTVITIPRIPIAQTARELSAIAAIVMIAGMLDAALALRLAATPAYATLDGRHVFVRAVMLERPRATSSGESVRVRITEVLAPRTAGAGALVGLVARVDFPAAAERHSQAGRYALIRARLEIPAGPRNEGERSERDIERDAGIAVNLVAHRGLDVRPLGTAPGWDAWWARLRARFADEIEARVAPSYAVVLEGVLWGDRGNLPANLRQEFSDTGTVHVLTTAGLHLGILAALIAALLVRVPLPRVARAVIVVAAGWAYALLAGFHVPTQRAAMMLTAGTIAYESGRARTASAVLSAAAFAVCLPHPLVLLSPSFSMSFACVGGIALLGPALARLGLDERLGFGHWPAELLRTSLAVQIALWPLQALYFNAFTPYAVVANLLVVPLVGAIMACGGTLLLVAMTVAPLAGPLANLTAWCVAIMNWTVDRIATLPAAHLDVPPPNPVFLVAYWCALGAFTWAANRGVHARRLVAWSATAIVALAGIYLAPGIAAALDPRLHLDAIDVGQADCLLIRAPGLHAMLVDGGGRLERTSSGAVVAQPIGDEIATRTVMPFLLRHWVLKLDAVVLTHPHGDHAGGLPVVLSREHVGTLYDSAQLYSGPAYQRALEVVREHHVAWRRALRGEAFDLGPRTHVTILAPELPLIMGTSSDINNNSVVLRVEFGTTAVLLTGDAQAEAEARLLAHGAAELHADILKVGHHGSAYSSTPEFVAAVQPKIAIISCGRHNVFGHPSPRTLAALRAAGATVYRTDVQGGISVQTDGTQVTAAAPSGL